jgi:hypothetical protein
VERLWFHKARLWSFLAEVPGRRPSAGLKLTFLFKPHRITENQHCAMVRVIHEASGEAIWIV